MNAKDRELIDLVRRSGLLVLDWYLARNPDVAAAGVDPIEHWYYTAQTESRDPNFLFSLRRYVADNAGTADQDLNALVHYMQAGEAKGISPSPYFDPAWYREH